MILWRFDIEDFIQTKRYPLVVDNPTSNLPIVRLDRAPEIPEERWGLMIGDCIHNLRSALDYIAWCLAGSDRAETNTQFPICTNRERWQDQVVRRLGRMTPAAIALIERTQPFHSTTPSHTPLNVIRVLSNTDKHKMITVVAAALSSFKIYIPVKNPEIVPTLELVDSPVLCDNAVLARIKITNAPVKVDVESHLAIDITFADTSIFHPRTRVIENIQIMINEVTAMIREFESQPGLFHE